MSRLVFNADNQHLIQQECDAHMDVTHLEICDTTLTHLPFSLPSSLVHLHCVGNALTHLPDLPPTLEFLDCSDNDIRELGKLPPKLQQLRCSNNCLTSLPQLPNTLILLDCAENNIQLHPLFVFPQTLAILNCSSNRVSYMPALPLSLQELDCSFNHLKQLTFLPPKLQVLDCRHNQLADLPFLPAELTDLDCSYNMIDVLPVLPQQLKRLVCTKNQLKSIPTLPSVLTFIACADNALVTLPDLPQHIRFIDCSKNLLKSLPPLPPSLSILHCGDNELTLPIMTVGTPQITPEHQSDTFSILDDIDESVHLVFVELNDLRKQMDAFAVTNLPSNDALEVLSNRILHVETTVMLGLNIIKKFNPQSAHRQTTAVSVGFEAIKKQVAELKKDLDAWRDLVVRYQLGAEVHLLRPKMNEVITAVYQGQNITPVEMDLLKIFNMWHLVSHHLNEKGTGAGAGADNGFTTPARFTDTIPTEPSFQVERVNLPNGMEIEYEPTIEHHHGDWLGLPISYNTLDREYNNPETNTVETVEPQAEYPVPVVPTVIVSDDDNVFLVDYPN